MANPVLVELSRGPLVESVHRGAYVVVDADGTVRRAAGDIGRPVFPRSAVKAIQALPLIESGAADRFGFGDRELALAQASHAGQSVHIETVRSMLDAAGLHESDLECGAHAPYDAATAAALVRRGVAAGPLSNNCSGKHAAMLCVAVHLGVDTKGYVNADHPVQRMVRDAVAAVTGARLGSDTCGVDGCSIPTYALGLDAMATGMSRLAGGRGLGRDRAGAARRLLAAATAEPLLIAGSGRFCTEVMVAAGGRLFAKTGAEGVYCGALPGRGIGFALKLDDGASRASEPVAAALAAALLGAEDPAAQRLAAMAGRPLYNWNGTEVGRLTARL